MPLYREQLDSMTCTTPGCNHQAHAGIFLHSACHPSSPTWAEYKDGVIEVACAQCGKAICQIAVAAQDAGGDSEDEAVQL